MEQREEERAGDRDWQKKLYEVIFKADTPAGKGFDIVLLLAIVLSILVVMLSSVESIQSVHGTLLRRIGWGFTFLFSIEYVLRLLCLQVRRPYVTSFFGVVDFLSVFPTYLAILMGGSGLFVVVRSLRILRVFRILKMGGYEKAGTTIWNSLKASRQKIIVFLLGVLSLMVLLLGHCHHDHGGLRRHRTAVRPRPGTGLNGHDSGLQHHCCPDRHRHCGYGEKCRCEGRAEALHHLRSDRPRCRRRILQSLRYPAIGSLVFLGAVRIR